MKLHYLILTLATLAVSVQAADVVPPVVPASATAVAPSAPKTPEEWLARMTDFSKNGSAFRDPKVFVPWTNTISEPGFYAAMANSAMDPSGWLNMMNSATNPNAVRNFGQFVDPSMYMHWMNAGMDPAFYTALMTQFSDPNKMMRWVMLPMDPKMWGAMMNMANPNMYMKWMMAPMDPRAWSMMGNMINPATYMGFMGAGLDPKTYGPIWGGWMNNQMAVPVSIDPSAVMGALGNGLLPSISAPVANVAPAAGKTPAANKVAATASKINLSGDALFKTSKSSIRDLSKDGKTQLDEIIGKIKAMGNIEQIKVIGHADPTGKKAANLKLSQLRAKTIKSYLVSHGVKSDVIISSGVGDTQPVVKCDAGLAKDKLKECNAPNRRVEIEITAKAK